MIRRARVVLAGTLVLLFLGLSFNAYACLVPLYGGASAAMDRDCSAPEEQPARQFCDAFKTLGVQAGAEHQPAIDCQTFCPEHTASLSSLFRITNDGGCGYDHPADGPPQDLLLKTSVLRL